MRRAAAPSAQHSSNKKQRFQPPFLSKRAGGRESEKENFVHVPEPSKASSSSQLTQVLQSVRTSPPQCSTLDNPEPQVLHVSPSKSTSCDIDVSICTQQNSTKSCLVEEVCPSIEESKYYSVMWCKYSKKKHKKWEGDAILITKGRSAVLKDMEGKDIGKDTGYKQSELVALSEGSTLFVGGKEIEVMGSISSDDWKTGKCFLNVPNSSGAANPLQVSRFAIKKFSNPLLSSAKVDTKKPCTNVKVVPLHNPSDPNALVMPRPNQQHQLEHNHEGLPVVDVVVDPHLVSHLRPHQREGVTFLYECILGMRDFQGYGSILADEMGLGKTLQCITVLWTLFKQSPYGRKPLLKRVLIITPGSLVQNWEKEFTKWLGSERIKVYAVSSEQKVQEYLKCSIYPVLVISYEMFVRYYEAVKSVPFDAIVCDEGHRLKNITIKTTSLITSLPTRRRIILTGTPIQNDLQEFYSILEFCNPGILGSQSAFHKVYEEPIVRSCQPAATPMEKELGITRATELSRLTSLFCLRRTQQINKKYLPAKVENVVFCGLSSLQLKLYHHLLRSSLVKACLSSSSDLSPHLVCIGVLKKLCNCPSLLYPSVSSATKDGENSLKLSVLEHYPSDFDSTKCNVEHSGKLKVLSNMLHQLHSKTKEKIVLVSNYTQTLDVLQLLCKSRGYLSLRLDGSTPASKRQPLVDRFNGRYCKETVFLLSSKAGGVGLNLTGASRLILYDIDWNPANDLQAMARVWRDGQKSQVHIYRLLSTGTIEEKIFQRQISKQGLNMVVDSPSADRERSSKTQFSLEELKDLFTLRESTLCDTHDLLNCGCVQATTGNGSNTRTLIANKIISVEELMNWEHFSQPLASAEINDELLKTGNDTITFLFQNITNATH